MSSVLRWPTGEPNKVERLRFDPWRVTAIAVSNGNMTYEQVEDCLLQGSTVCTATHEYRMEDSTERWQRVTEGAK